MLVTTRGGELLENMFLHFHFKYVVILGDPPRTSSFIYPNVFDLRSEQIWKDCHLPI